MFNLLSVPFAPPHPSSSPQGSCSPTLMCQMRWEAFFYLGSTADSLLLNPAPPLVASAWRPDRRAAASRLQLQQQKLGKPPRFGTSQPEWHQQEIKLNQYVVGEGEDDEIAFLSRVVWFLYQENKKKCAWTADSSGVNTFLCAVCHMVPLRCVFHYYIKK